mmetsp:Transcript_5946/g.14901  ORF Transcript_5946/g.14901 Transcript_5946/m.14901 type:complete len:527 (-) Transcript_5946:56-1636(-)
MVGIDHAQPELSAGAAPPPQRPPDGIVFAPRDLGPIHGVHGRIDPQYLQVRTRALLGEDVPALSAEEGGFDEDPSQVGTGAQHGRQALVRGPRVALSPELAVFERQAAQFGTGCQRRYEVGVHLAFRHGSAEESILAPRYCGGDVVRGDFAAWVGLGAVQEDTLHGLSGLDDRRLEIETGQIRLSILGIDQIQMAAVDDGLLLTMMLQVRGRVPDHRDVIHARLLVRVKLGAVPVHAEGPHGVISIGQTLDEEAEGSLPLVVVRVGGGMTGDAPPYAAGVLREQVDMRGDCAIRPSEFTLGRVQHHLLCGLFGWVHTHLLRGLFLRRCGFRGRFGFPGHIFRFALLGGLHLGDVDRRDGRDRDGGGGLGSGSGGGGRRLSGGGGRLDDGGILWNLSRRRRRHLRLRLRIILAAAAPSLLLVNRIVQIHRLRDIPPVHLLGVPIVVLDPPQPMLLDEFRHLSVVDLAVELLGDATSDVGSVLFEIGGAPVVRCQRWLRLLLGPGGGCGLAAALCRPLGALARSSCHC